MKIVLLIYIFLYFYKQILCIDPLVLTSHGLVLGSRAVDGNYSMFLGIPYAKVNPDNPFGAPVDSEPFEDVYEAFDDSAVCPQREDFNYSIVGKLDCLHVNLYVPHKATSHNLLPVMIWIHGGGFGRGFSNRHSYGPKFIVEHDIILITFNYRLSIYGFLSLNTPDIPGNAGLRDQLAALKWIKRNAVAFGGNTNSITLFGESAGGASVEFHMLSGLADGLFNKVIMQSGSTFSDWVMDEPDQSVIHQLAMGMGLHTNDKEIALNYLKQADPHEVIKATVDLNYTFKPCVENIFERVEAMIRNSPSNMFKSGFYKDIPILSGFNNIEKLEDLHYYELSHNYFKTAGKTFNAKLASYFNFSKEELSKASKLVEQFYFGDGRVIEDSIQEMIEFDSDFTFVHPLQRSTLYHLIKNKNPIYQYIFSYSGHRNYMKQRLNITLDGASHADEIGYLFEQSYMTSPISSNDQILIDRLTRMWTNFAKYSDPTPYATDLIPIKWEPTEKDIRRFLVIDNKLHMSYHPYHQRMAFWDLFFNLYGDKAKW